MNILYITQFFSPSGGGGEVVFSELVKGMARRGHDVHVICFQLSNFKDDCLDRVTVHRINPVLENKGGSPPSIRKNISYIVNAILKGTKIIRKKKIDIIHTNNFSPVIPGIVLAKMHKVPVLTTVHVVLTTSSPDYWKNWAAQQNISRISSVIGPRFEKFTVRLPNDIIHAVSNATREDLLKFSAKPRIVVIPNGIDLTDHEILEHKKCDYQNYVLFIARLIFYKNLDVVISSFKEVAKKLPDAKLIVVGDGPMRQSWEKMVLELGLNQNIEFTGFVSHEKKFELLSRCSALLVPSPYEGFPMVLLEAFAMSKPVLVADVKPYGEIVQEGIDGFMLPPHDPDRWSERIIHLLSNKNICKNMGGKGRQKVENEFNLNNVVQRMESLYIELCSQRKG
jgi:glycosyltransferase involved in cell wall biosynthesis